MPSSGRIENVFKGSTSGGYALRIDWSIISQDVLDNTSNVNFKVYLVSYGDNWHISSTAEKYLSLMIDGVNYSKSERGLAALDAWEVKELFSRTVLIRHEIDGSRSLDVSCSFGIEARLSGEYVEWCYCPASGSSTITLNAIPRATTPTTTGAMLVGNTITINLPRLSSSFLHLVSYSVDGQNWTQIAANVSTSCTWMLPSLLANAIPAATSGTVLIRATTYYGTINVGSAIITKTYGVSEEYAAPEVSVTVSSSDAIGANKFIKGISTVTLSASVSLLYGAKAVKYTFTYGGVSKIVTSENSSESVTFTLPANASASYAVSVTLVDSRGFADSASSTITPQEYAKPQMLSLNYRRGKIIDGEFVESNKGKSVNVIATGLISALQNENAKNYKIEYRLPTEVNYTDLTEDTLESYNASIDYFSDEVFSENSSYIFRVSFADSFHSVSQIMDVTSQRVLLNFSANGRAICIGGIASVNDACEIQMQSYQTGGIKPMPIAIDTDFNDISHSGKYIGNASTGSYSHCPISSESFGLDVDIVGAAGQLVQRITPADETNYKSYLRLYDGVSWSDWMIVYGVPEMSISSGLSGQITTVNGLLIQWGVACFAPSAENVPTTKSIEFPNEYAVKPIVSVSIMSEHPFIVAAGCTNVDTRSAKITVSRTNTNAVMVSWLAIGKGAS